MTFFNSTRYPPCSSPACTKVGGHPGPHTAACPSLMRDLGHCCQLPAGHGGTHLHAEPEGMTLTWGACEMCHGAGSIQVGSPSTRHLVPCPKCRPAQPSSTCGALCRDGRQCELAEGHAGLHSHHWPAEDEDPRWRALQELVLLAADSTDSRVRMRARALLGVTA